MENLITTLDAAGTLFIAWAALSVHHKVLSDHKISNDVSRKMRAEQKLGILGVTLILVSYVLNIFY